MSMTRRLTKYEGLDIFRPSIEPDTMRKRFNALPIATRRRAVFKHRLLLTEYYLLRMKIVAGFTQAIQPDDLKNTIDDASQVAEMLSIIYGCYLHIPREAHALHADLNQYQRWLQRPETLPTDLPAKESERLIVIRMITGEKNIYRLLVSRLRRFLMLTADVANFSDNAWLNQGLSFMNNRLYGDLIFAHIGYLWFTPRLFANTLLFLNHVIPDKSLSVEEYQLGALWRALTQLDRRWFQLSNDWVWVIGGLLIVGPLAPIAPYVSVAMLGFDVVCAGLNAYIELSRLNKLLDEYRSLKLDDTFLTKHLFLEKIRLWLSVINTVVVCLGMALALPGLALAPEIVLVAAAVILVMTVATFITLRLIEHQKAPMKLADVKNNTLKISDNSASFFHGSDVSAVTRPVLALN